MIAEATIQLEEVLDLAIRLSPLDKVKLLGRVASTLETEPVLMQTSSLLSKNSPSTVGWGVKTLEMLNSLDTSEWEEMEIPDVVEWVKQLRYEQEQQRGLSFGGVRHECCCC